LKNDDEKLLVLKSPFSALGTKRRFQEFLENGSSASPACRSDGVKPKLNLAAVKHISESVAPALGKTG
jgi:hypothetical protein